MRPDVGMWVLPPDHLGCTWPQTDKFLSQSLLLLPKSHHPTLEGSLELVTQGEVG